MDHSKHLIDKHNLSPHPEGGYYREVFRSPHQVEWHGQSLSASTAIYFLLQANDRSWCHRIPQDEAWHFYDGAPLELIFFNEDTPHLEQRILSADNPLAIVPGGWWQAAHTLGQYSFIGCTVSPGFAFHLFELLKDTPEKRHHFRRTVPGFAQRDT